MIACGDDANLEELLSAGIREDIRIIRYGKENPKNDFQLSRIHLEASSGVARITHKGKVLGDLVLTIPGEHNLLNASAALAAAHALGVGLPEVLAGLTEFSGSRRRFELKGIANNVKVIDDYGHHPTEVRVTLETARRFAAGGKVFVVFQPHRFTRTQMFAREFAEALDLADQIYLLEIYAASEPSIQGVSSLLIAQNRDSLKFHYQPSMIEVIEEVSKAVTPGDVVLTLGAGDVNSLGPELLHAIGERFANFAN